MARRVPPYQGSRGYKTSPRPTQDDPLLNITLAPSHETAQQRAERETSETEAKALSEEIDRQLYRDQDTLINNQDTIRILLLGQSESGKSTTLKNFQLFHSPHAFDTERKAWRYVILLNLARSVRIILELMEDHFALQDEYNASRSSITYTLRRPHTSSGADTELSRERGSHDKHRAISHSSTHKNGDTEREARKNKKGAAKKKFSIEGVGDLINGNNWKEQARSYSAALPNNPIRKGKYKEISAASSADSTLSPGGARGISRASSLNVSPAPRHQIRSQLSDVLKLPTGPLLTPHHRLLKMKLAPLAAVESQLLYELSIPAEDEVETHCPWQLGRRRDHKELIIRPLGCWEEKFGRLRIGTPKWLSEEPKVREPNDPSHIISACAHDVSGLWNDSAIRELLAQNGIHLECEPGFFLNDVDRVAKLDYNPTDDDILRARFRTHGVCEYKFKSGKANRDTRRWVIYDFGGTRTQRAVWQSYFDDVDAIIFLVPLSAFDQNLVEDPTMNRMEDSVQLFQSVCRSRLLTRVNIILFLNKVDLLEAKLKAGVRVNEFIKNYGSRGNTPEEVIGYFRHFFTGIHKKATPIGAERIFYSHATSVTNPYFMRSIMEILRDVIIRNNVEDLVL